MAQGAVAVLPATNITSDQVRFEIAELAKILRFRDEVLAGRHSKFRLPTNRFGALSAAPSSNSPLPLTPLSAAQAFAADLSKSKIHNGDGLSASVHGLESVDSSHVTIAGPIHSGFSNSDKSSIDPILLEKSADLIKAEIQLKRQRLERGLREQVEQRRLASKAAAQSAESLPDFDLSDVLFKAIALVHPSATTTAAEVEPSVGARSASDSFDENTFYSSQHDTPELDTPRLEEQISDIPTANAAISTENRTTDQYGRVWLTSAQNTSSEGLVASDREEVQASLSDRSKEASKAALAPKRVPLQSSRPVPVHPMTPVQYGKHFVDITIGDSDAEHPAAPAKAQQGEVSELSTTVKQGQTEARVVQTTTDELIEDAFPPSPRIFSANPLTKIPPQPAQPAASNDVSLTRSLPQVVSSPDSSPKAGKVKGKKKKKKDKAKEKKRKSNGKEPAFETPDTPYIKPEPRSPSPFASVPLQRPAKRQRHSLNQDAGDGLNYDEPSNEDSGFEFQGRKNRGRGNHRGGHRQQQSQQQARSRHGQQDYEQEYDPAEPMTSIYRQDPHDQSQRRRDIGHSTRQSAPRATSVYAPSRPFDDRAIRDPSVVVVDQSLRTNAPHYYRNEGVLPRSVVRPEADRERSRSPIMYERQRSTMAPPQQVAPRKVIVDDYGHYYESGAPAVRVSQRPSEDPYVPYAFQRVEQVVYEPPVRAIPRAVLETRNADGTVYRTSSPMHMNSPRRLVTQPPYDPEYRAYRQREPSVRPPAMAPPSEDFLRPSQTIVQKNFDHSEAPHSDYRSGSMRPETNSREQTHGFAPRRLQSVRPDSTYEAAGTQYTGRLQSARAEPAPRGYAPEAYLPAVPQAEYRADSHIPPQPRYREYSVRPAEKEYTPTQYAVRPARDPYGTPSQQSPYGPPGTRQIIRQIVEDPGYTEPPRQAMYQELPRDSVYR